VEIPLVYEIFNFFMNKRNKNYLLYMCVALIALQKEQILHADDDLLHNFVNKSLKTFTTKQDLQLFFDKTEQIEKATPKSFEILSKKLGFCERSCTYPPTQSTPSRTTNA
jgi:hypothetical protein